MPDSFIDKLRMNGIFTPQNQNPIGPPDLSAGGLNMNTVSQGLNLIKGYTENAQDKRMRDQQNMMLFQKSINDPTRNQYGGLTPEYKQALSQFGNNPNLTPVASPNVGSNINPITGMSNAQEAALDLKKDTGDNATKLKQAQLAEKTKNDQSKIDLGWDKNAQGWDKNSISRASEQVRQFKAQNPNHKLISVPGGNIIAVDPITNKVTDLGIPSGMATSLQQIDERGKVNSNLETQRQTGRETLQGIRGQQQLTNIGTRLAGQQQLQDDRQATPLPGNQTKVDTVNRANQLKNQRPDLAPYIEIDQQGNVNIAQPSGNGWFEGGPPLGTWNEINSILYGGSGSANQNNGYDIKPSTSSKGSGINTSPSSSGGYKVGIE